MRATRLGELDANEGRNLPRPNSFGELDADEFTVPFPVSIDPGDDDGELQQLPTMADVCSPRATGQLRDGLHQS